MRQPNFFILGAPKCGTTSLASWLREHPNVFLSRPKEPNYFAEDFELPWHWDLERYEQLFSDAGPEHRIVGEASTMYLRSHVAITEILRYAPDARFVVGIRNPVRMVVSLHRQRINEALESEECLEHAWYLQASRRAGYDLPERCRDPKLLMYADFCRLGEQLSCLLEHVPRDRVFIYSLDEMRRDPRAVWMDLMDFLDLPDDGRAEFPVENKARNQPRWLNLALRLANQVKMKLGLHCLKLGVMSGIQRKLAKQPANDVPLRFKRELADYFKADIERLADITGRDLSAWTQPDERPESKARIWQTAREV